MQNLKIQSSIIIYVNNKHISLKFEVKASENQYLGVYGFTGVELLLPEVAQLHQHVLVHALVKEAFAHRTNHIVDHGLQR